MMLQILIVSAILGFLTPYVASFLRYLLLNGKASKPLVYALTLLFALSVGFFSALAQGVLFNDVTTIVASMGVAFTFTNATYNLILKTFDTDAKIEKAVKAFKS